MKTFSVSLFIIAFTFLSQAQSNKYLDKNKVKARIFINNDKFWNFSGTGSQAYEVPVGSGKHAMFANSIWIGGLDASNQLHVAANTYKQSGTDFWSGPLDTANIANYSAIANSPYNRLWKIDCNDINNFISAYNAGSVTANTYTVPNDILNYPGIGTSNFQRKFAPFYDANNNGLYDPLTAGDYPLIRGHQQILSVFNDQRSSHGESFGLPMGVEIHERSYAFSEPAIHDSMKAVNYTTFYHYTIFNRSNTNFHDVYVSDWSDVDLGYYLDDYIGSDTVNNFAYCYNSSANDPTAFGVNGYGNQPPVASHVIMPTDCSSDGIDNDNDQLIDEPGETFKMNKVTYYANNIGSVPSVMTNPSTSIDFYNYMSGFWKDNTPFTFGGNAYGGTTPAAAVYPGDPVTNTGWTETSAGNATGDRRLIVTSGPFSLRANSKIEWGYAIVFSQDTSQAVNTITQFNSRVQRDVRNVKYYHANHLNPQCTPQITYHVGLNELPENKITATAYPNPGSGKYIIELNKNVASAKVLVFDLTGKIIRAQKIENSYRAEIDLSEFASGVYFLQINSGNEQSHIKLIKN